MAVGAFRSVTIDVDDMAKAEAFWSAALGLDVQFPAYRGQFSRIGKKGEPSVLLQLVPERKTDLKNRVHVDLTVEDVAKAVEEVIALGGTLVRAPGLYPDDDDPLLEWAVVADPFGNEFCVIRDCRPTL